MGEAILEWTYPSYSVFTDAGNPSPVRANILGDISQIVDLAQATMANRPTSDSTSDPLRGATLLEDGAAADPPVWASPSCWPMRATQTRRSKGLVRPRRPGELQYLLYGVPRVGPAGTGEGSCR